MANEVGSVIFRMMASVEWWEGHITNEERAEDEVQASDVCSFEQWGKMREDVTGVTESRKRG